MNKLYTFDGLITIEMIQNFQTFGREILTKAGGKNLGKGCRTAFSAV